MSLPRTTSRRDLIKRFHELGWEGPYSGSKHEYMVKGMHEVRVPNPHRGDIRVGLLGIILEHAGISDDEWRRTK
ncbi:MAG: type II toxin-antitoxin system HicA family toxin [Acidimicrobiales bacterium]